MDIHLGSLESITIQDARVAHGSWFEHFLCLSCVLPRSHMSISPVSMTAYSYVNSHAVHFLFFTEDFKQEIVTMNLMVMNSLFRQNLLIMILIVNEIGYFIVKECDSFAVMTYDIGIYISSCCFLQLFCKQGCSSNMIDKYNVTLYS